MVMVNGLGREGNPRYPLQTSSLAGNVNINTNTIIY